MNAGVENMSISKISVAYKAALQKSDPWAFQGVLQSIGRKLESTEAGPITKKEVKALVVMLQHEDEDAIALLSRISVEDRKALGITKYLEPSSKKKVFALSAAAAAIVAGGGILVADIALKHHLNNDGIDNANLP